MATPRKDPKDLKKRGRKPFKPTEDQRKEVATLAAANYVHDAIAQFIGIDPDTLRKHFPAELARSKMKMIGNAVSKLVEAVNKGEAWAVCFTLKTQGKNEGWSERLEHTGKDGAPLNFENMTDAELDKAIGRLTRYLSSRRAEG